MAPGQDRGGRSANERTPALCHPSKTSHGWRAGAGSHECASKRERTATRWGTVLSRERATNRGPDAGAEARARSDARRHPSAVTDVADAAAAATIAGSTDRGRRRTSGTAGTAGRGPAPWGRTAPSAKGSVLSPRRCGRHPSIPVAPGHPDRTSSAILARSPACPRPAVCARTGVARPQQRSSDAARSLMTQLVTRLNRIDAGRRVSGRPPLRSARPRRR